MDKISLSEEMETLLIPLFGKARESRKTAPVLFDKKAVEIIGQIDYFFTSLKIPEKTNVMMCLRAKIIDNFVKDYLDRSNGSVALHLGCGLVAGMTKSEIALWTGTMWIFQRLLPFADVFMRNRIINI